MITCQCMAATTLPRPVGRDDVPEPVHQRTGNQPMTGRLSISSDSSVEDSGR